MKDEGTPKMLRRLPPEVGPAGDDERPLTSGVRRRRHLKSVRMMRPEGKEPMSGQHQCDGRSSARRTEKGGAADGGRNVDPERCTGREGTIVGGGQRP
jgi:hypothetical protein